MAAGGARRTRLQALYLAGGSAKAAGERGRAMRLNLQEAPGCIAVVLKSYDLSLLDSSDVLVQATLVAETLTRGVPGSEDWLWTQMTLEEAREVTRIGQGAGLDNEARAVLRERLGLTLEDVPDRPFSLPAWRSPGRTEALPRPT